LGLRPVLVASSGHGLIRAMLRPRMTLGNSAAARVRHCHPRMGYGDHFHRLVWTAGRDRLYVALGQGFEWLLRVPLGMLRRFPAAPQRAAIFLARSVQADDFRGFLRGKTRVKLRYASSSPAKRERPVWDRSRESH
jgi:hypothetical protein